MIDLISRQEAIEAVQCAMRNGGEWRKALEMVPSCHIEMRLWSGGMGNAAATVLPHDPRMDADGGNGHQGPYLKLDTQPPQPETYTHDAAWWKEHHDMGFESPIYDIFKALGVYDDEEDDPNGQL